MELFAASNFVLLSFFLKCISPFDCPLGSAFRLVTPNAPNGLLAGWSTQRSARDEHDGDDESIEGESLSEDHHKNEGDQDISLGVSTNTGVTDHTDAETGSKGGETTTKTSSELFVCYVIVVPPILWTVNRSWLV